MKNLKKIITISLLTITVMSLAGCNTMTRQFGGTSTVELPKGQKLVNVTWKESDLWYLTKPMTDNDKAETYEFTEDSNLGMMEGKVIIKESK